MDVSRGGGWVMRTNELYWSGLTIQLELQPINEQALGASLMDLHNLQFCYILWMFTQTVLQLRVSSKLVPE